MKFCETLIPGMWIVDPEPHTDARGVFARWFDPEVFARHGLHVDFAQDSFARNERAGTLRGLHFQAEPHAEAKLVVCVSGAMFDTVVDLRPGAGFGTHVSIEMSAATWRSVYIPRGCAHGYQSLCDDTTVLYRIAGSYTPSAVRGVRWDDPALAIAWPLAVTSISERDADLPLLSEIRRAGAGDVSALMNYFSEEER